MFLKSSPRRRNENFAQCLGFTPTRSSSLNSTKTTKSLSNQAPCLDFSSFRSPSKRFLNDPSTLYEIKEEKKAVKGMTPEQVLNDSRFQLTELEKDEIKVFPEVFYIGKALKKHDGKYDDEKGYYRTFVGDQIAFRYEILHILGDGSFGIVISCIDHKLQIPVAIKILRRGAQFEENGRLEGRNLSILSSNGAQETIIQKFEEFIFRNHYCIVFELLSVDLYQFLKQRHFQGLALNVLRRIAVQLLMGLKHIHEEGLIHCDLKPENILFKISHKSSIKLIDFGSACLKNEKTFTYIQSRYYRAPEIILEIDYSEKIDIWSLGCILFELFTGCPLFMGNDDIDQLCRMIEAIGDIPAKMINLSPRKKELFDEKGRLLLANSQGIMPGCNRISAQLRKVDSDFVEFLNECLKLEPGQRFDANAALKHPWIRGNKTKRHNKSTRVLYKSLNLF
jgi:dual specificity tyrosine-phosphorylation-regulated kinase 2/3/4